MCNCQCIPQPVYKNPDQMEFLGLETRFPEKYQEGFNTGVTWDANWMPGGPWIYKGKNDAMHEADKLKHKNWMDGFSAGLALRLKINPHFAAWWNRNKGLRHVPGVTIDQIRYREPEEIYPAYQEAA
jgi:hypothetical protein